MGETNYAERQKGLPLRGGLTREEMWEARAADVKHSSSWRQQARYQFGMVRELFEHMHRRTAPLPAAESAELWKKFTRRFLDLHFDLDEELELLEATWEAHLQ